jgi:hypothetical protein
MSRFESQKVFKKWSRKNNSPHSIAALTLHQSRQQHERCAIEFGLVTDTRYLKVIILSAVLIFAWIPLIIICGYINEVQHWFSIRHNTSPESTEKNIITTCIFLRSCFSILLRFQVWLWSKHLWYFPHIYFYSFIFSFIFIFLKILNFNVLEIF